MKLKYIIPLLVILAPSAWGQIVIKSGANEIAPDLTLQVGKNVIAADVGLLIGPNLVIADFSVGVTNKINKANFIVTEGIHLKHILRVQAGDSVIAPDISIQAGGAVIAPDVRVKVKTSGAVDYLVYIDKQKATMVDLVVAILPAINKKLGYKLKRVPRIK